MVVRSIQDTRLELQFCHTIPMYLRGWSSSWCWPWWRGGKEHYYSNLYATAPENFYMFLEHVSCTAAHISHQVPVSIFPSTWARVSPSNRWTKPEFSHIISNAQCLEDIAVEYCNRCHLPKLNCMVIITRKWRKTKTLSVTHVHFIQRLKVQLCRSKQ